MAYFPVPDDAFKDALPKSVGDYLVIILNWLWNAVAKVTTHDTHVYANGTSGDDANDGLSAGTPKKTLQAVFALLPDIIKYNTAVHLDGVFSEQGHSYIFSHVSINILLVIDGDNAVIDTGEGPLTATGSSVTSLTVAAAGWGANAHHGYWIRFASGPLSDEDYQIQSNTADTLVPFKNFALDPGNADFQIVRPLTELAASSVHSKLQICCSGGGTVCIQNLYFSGTKSGFFVKQCQSLVAFSKVVSDATPIIYLQNSNAVQFNSTSRDPNTFGTVLGNCSIAIRAACVEAWDVRNGFSFGALLNKMVMRFSNCANMFSSAKLINQLELRNCFEISSSNTIRALANWQPPQFGYAGGTSIIVENSAIKISDADISDSGLHGIEAINSMLNFTDVVSGTGNAGAGVYAHSGSIVHIKDGSPPTLTGAIGDISTDGTTEATTFAAVDGGEAYSDDLENTAIKEVA